MEWHFFHLSRSYHSCLSIHFPTIVVHSVSFFQRYICTDKIVKNGLRWIFRILPCILSCGKNKATYSSIPHTSAVTRSFFPHADGWSWCASVFVYYRKCFPLKIAGIFQNRRVIASLLISRSTRISRKISNVVNHTAALQDDIWHKIQIDISMIHIHIGTDDTYIRRHQIFTTVCGAVALNNIA